MAFACRGSLKEIITGNPPPPTGGVPVIVATGPVVSTVNVPFGKIYEPLVEGSTVICVIPTPGRIVIVQTLLAASGVRLSIEPPVTLRSALVSVIACVEVSVTVNGALPPIDLSGVRVSGGAALRTMWTTICVHLRQ